jgi:ribosomal protein L13
VSLGATGLFSGEGSSFERDQIDLEHRAQVEHIVGKVTSNRVLPRLLVDVVVTLEGLHKRADLPRSDIGDHVHILGATSHAMK